MRYAQLVIGPAGSGKSTYCAHMEQYLLNTHRRRVHIVNMDPAAEELPYEPVTDVRDQITADDVMQYCRLGPNGSLVYALEQAINEETGWFDELFGDYDDDYLLIDCPGQIELFTHYTFMSNLCRKLERKGFKLLTVYLIEASRFNGPVTSYISASLSCMSAMVNLATPYISLISKIDLLTKEERERVESEMLVPDSIAFSSAMEEPGLLEFKLPQFGMISSSEDIAKINQEIEKPLPSADSNAAKEGTGAKIAKEEGKEEKKKNKLMQIYNMSAGFNKKLMELLMQQSLVSYIPFTPLEPELSEALVIEQDMILNYGEAEECVTTDGYEPTYDDGDNKNRKSESYYGCPCDEDDAEYFEADNIEMNNRYMPDDDHLDDVE